MTDRQADAHEGESNSDMESPNPSSSSSAHLDNAQGSASDDGVLFDPKAASDDPAADGVGADSVRGAFPPKDSRRTRKPGRLGGAVGTVKSFLLDSPEQRGQRKSEQVPSVTTPRGESARDSPTAATAVAPPSKVSRRARLLGGNRGKATLLMAALLVTVVLTIINTITIATKPSQGDIEAAVSEQLRTQGRDFPGGQAVTWADQLVVDWATWDEDDKDNREVRMATYLTQGMDPQAGWNEKGKQSVTFTSANPEPTVLDSNHALVDVDYRLSDSSRRCVSVPVYAYRPEGLTGENVQWAFGLSGNPIPRPCAPRTGAMEPSEQKEANKSLSANDELSRDLTSNFFPGFFSAWAASDSNSLRQYTASGVTTIGLGGAMSSTPPPSVNDVVVLTPRNTSPKEGAVYHATVPVTWTIAGSSAQVTATYDVPMKLLGDRWYVAGEPIPASSSSDAESGSPGSKVNPEKGTEGDDSSPDASPESSDK